MLRESLRIIRSVLVLFLLSGAAAAWQQTKGDASVPSNTGTADTPGADVGETRIESGTANCPASLNVPRTTAKRGVPLPAHCKFSLFLRQTYSTYTFVSAGFEATWDQATAQWPQYGGGMAGFGKRFGATLADTEARRFIQNFALSTALRQDPRYFPSEKNGLVRRAWYAATRVIIGRKDDGDHTFNSPELVGALLTSALQNSYYPRHYRTFENTMSRFGGALSSDILGNVLHEFTPDLMRIFRKHEPQKVKEIERMLPIPGDDKS